MIDINTIFNIGDVDTLERKWVKNRGYKGDPLYNEKMVRCRAPPRRDEDDFVERKASFMVPQASTVDSCV